MTHRSPSHGGSPARALAVLAVTMMVCALLPLVGTAAAQDADPPPLSAACPFEPQASGFADRESVPDAHRSNVDCAAFLNIVQGFADNTYRPRLLVRRDQIASFISLTLDAAGVLLPSGASDQFTDIAADSPHRPHITRLAEVGIIQGGPGALPPTQFGPGLRVRRDALASLLMRAAGYAFHNDPDAFGGDFNGPEDQRFTDVPAGNVHYGNVNAAAHLGIAAGVSEGTYRPRAAARRDQIASFVVRLLNFLTTRPALELRLVVEPVDAHPGDTVSATAAVTRDGEPVEGVDVSFAVPGGADPGTGSAQTDAEGLARFSFTVTRVGSVPVTARATVDGQQLVATATVTVVPAPLVVLGLVVDQDQAEVGELVTATATVTRDGNPVQGVEVAFSTSEATAEPNRGTGTTGANGQATFSFRPMEAGPARVTAVASPQGQQLTVEAAFTVVSSLRLDLALDPDSPVRGETVTVTATVSRGGQPLPGVEVSFTTSGARTQPASGGGETDAGGQVTFTFVPSETGALTVTAEATVGDELVRTSVERTVAEPDSFLGVLLAGPVVRGSDGSGG